MTFNRVFVLSLMLVFSNVVFSDDDIKWKQVRIYKEINESLCLFKSQMNCSDHTAKCEKWHKKKAAKQNANAIVIINQWDQSMTADYYYCNKK
ncbi:MAG: hypothetical protein ACRBCS_08220 [Cellvibrionaceae bacterium]